MERSKTELDVDWAPPYELVLSAGTYGSRKLHKDIDLGPAWARDVKRHLPATLQEQIDELIAESDKSHSADDIFLSFARLCPGERTIPHYFDWVVSLSAGQMYELLAPRWPEGMAMPRDLATLRDRHVTILQSWHEHYFRHLDPAILAGLEAEAARVRAELGSADPVELFERVTNGIAISPTADLGEVILVPQHHMVPFNSLVKGHHFQIILYPADVTPSAPDAPPPALRRLARALADESRLRILRLLGEEPRTLTQIARAARLAQSTVHHHLLALRTAGLVRVHLDAGQTGQYTLRPNAVDLVSEQLRTYLTPLSGVGQPASGRRSQKRRRSNEP